MTALEIVLVAVVGAALIFLVPYIYNLLQIRKNKINMENILSTRLHKGGIVFFGDSLTDFFPVEEFFPHLEIFNRGIAGDTTKQLIERIENVTILQPTDVYLLIGTNDMGQGKKPHKIVESIESIVDILQRDIENVNVHIESLSPVSKTKSFYSFLLVGRRTNKKLKQTNVLLKGMCERRNLEYIDIFTPLSTEKGTLNNLYTIEGLHFSAKGYQVIAHVLKNYLPKKEDK